MSRDGERKYVKLAFYYFGINTDTLLVVNSQHLGENHAIWQDKTLWVKNQRRLSTTDAFNIDWFYCKAAPSINADYINKESTQCLRPDRIGVIRPVFKDRICDGFVDCFGKSDEDGGLGKCLVDKTKHEIGGSCSLTLLGTQVHIEECKGTRVVQAGK